MLFEPEIVIEKRSGKRLGKGTLIHVLKYNPQKDEFYPSVFRRTSWFEVKNMIRVIDYSLRF